MELTYQGDIFIWFIWKIKAHAKEGGEEALNKVIYGKARREVQPLTLFYKISKIVRAFWLVKNLWFIVPVNSFYKIDRPHFLRVYRRDNHLGRWENTLKACKSLAFSSWFTSFSRVLPTSRVGYHAGKPIESVVYS